MKTNVSKTMVDVVISAVTLEDLMCVYVRLDTNWNQMEGHVRKVSWCVPKISIFTKRFVPNILLYKPSVHSGLYNIHFLCLEIFYDSYQQIYYVKEDAPIGTLVTKVKATLARRHGHNMFFSIVAENLKTEHPTFKMNYTNGEITVNTSLDRETVSEYLLEIEAKHLNDKKKWTKARSFVVIRILDINDNAPLFSHPAYTITVPCNVKPGSILYRIDTFDQDEGKNAQVTYKLEPENPYFTVQKHSGKVKVLKGLHEFCNESSSSSLKRFEYKIIATDRGSPALKSLVRVRFIIAAVDLTSQTMFVWYTENHDVKFVRKSSRKTLKQTDSS